MDEEIKSISQQSLSLSTDKPLYQPGQTLHLRVLALDRAGHADANAKLRLDVHDPDSTLVFRAEAITSRFGIAAADWQIPSRIRLGSYKLQVSRSGTDSEDSNSHDAQTSVRISRYDLPAFTVMPKADKPFYLPGQNANVEVRGLYLFGKPVVHGHVRVVRETERTWNVQTQKYDTTEGAVYRGELDNSGVFTAHVNLAEDEKPYRNVGDEDEQNEYEDLHLAAYVTDASTGRTEQRRFDVRIARRPLHVQVFHGAVVAGLPLGVNVAVTTADGVPAANTAVQLALLPVRTYAARNTGPPRSSRALLLKEVRTDAHGLARVDGLPTFAELLRKQPPPVLPLREQEGVEEDPTAVELLATAHSAGGETGSGVGRISVPSTVLRITTDHALYKPGEPIIITITSAQATLPVHVQVLRQTASGPLTLTTANLQLQHGRATLTVAAGGPDKPDERFAGYITVAAAALALPAAPEATQRDTDAALAFHTVLYPRDHALHVDVRMQHDRYRPGDTADATVRVSGSQDVDGEDNVAARFALGVVAVDQAVNERSRSDNEFGGSGGGGFFLPWRGSSRAWQHIGGVSLADVEQRDSNVPFDPALELAASMLLEDGDNELRLVSDAPALDLHSVFSRELDHELHRTRKTLETYLKSHTELPVTLPELETLLAADGISFTALRDPWQMPFRLTSRIERGEISLRAASNGPDKLPGTPDDFDSSLARWEWFATHESDLRRALISDHQRTGGFIHDLASLTAALRALGITLAAWRDPWGQPFTFDFSVDETQYVIQATTQGPPPANGHTRRSPFLAGRAGIGWFDDRRVLVQDALASYAEGHAFPATKTEFEVAMRRFGIPPAKLTDPWGRALTLAFHTRAIYTDRISVQATAENNGTATKRTTVAPVTATVDSVDLLSLGAEQKPAQPAISVHPSRGFVVATFSHLRSAQSAAQNAPGIATHAAVGSGDPQVTAGVLTGTVTDATGATIPGARVVATNNATRNEFEGQTDAQGSYVLGPMPAATYTVRFEAAGFTTTVVDQVRILSPEATLLDTKLQVGSVSEAVEVSASSVSLETQSASIGSMTTGYGGRLTNQSISDLVMKPGVGPAPPPPAAAPNGKGTPRVREYFPETLLWRPEVITADDGTAALRFPVADTITAWQLSVAASTLHGNTGFGATSFSTFLDFFAAFDPPQTLTVNDRVALPVTLRNYLDRPVTVQSTLRSVPWLAVDTPPGKVVVPSQDSASPMARLTATATVVQGKLLFTARPDAGTGDSIERTVTVHPDGLEAAVTAAGLVNGTTSFQLNIPADALPGSAEASLKIYPNFGAHLQDALVAMAAYPNGCAEQITSIAWPSLLLQRYAASLPAPNKVLQIRTRLQLEAAYANLLANRDSSGGFGYWPSSRKPDLALTAYVVEFLVAARAFITVDDAVITSAIAFLSTQQTKEGFWIARNYDGTTRASDRDGNAMLTASVAAMIAGAPGAEDLIAKALQATQPFVVSIDEPYTMANYALAALAVHDSARSAPVVGRLRTLALTENGGAYWALETNTPFFGWGRAGRVETTAMVLRALLASGATGKDALVSRGLLFLDHQQDRQSLWYSTQASARVLDVLAAIALAGQHAPAKGASPGALTVRVDGAAVSGLALPAQGVDSGPLFVPLGSAFTPGTHTVLLDAPANMPSATAQVVANVYVPWPKVSPAATTTNNEQLRLAVHFDATSNEPGKPVHAAAHIERLGFRGYGMLIAEIGLPPGADVDRATLESAVSASGYALNHYEVLPDKLLLYLWPQAGGYDLHFSFSLRYAVDALTAPSAVYDYYNPDARLDVPPQRFTSATFSAHSR